MKTSMYVATEGSIKLENRTARGEESLSMSACQTQNKPILENILCLEFASISLCWETSSPNNKHCIWWESVR